MFHRLRRSIDRGKGVAQPSSDISHVQIEDFGASVTQGARPHQEDRYIALKPGGLASRPELALFGVFDGHAGATVAEHAQSRLANHINETLSHTSSKTVETYTSAIQAALDEEDKCIDREDFTGGSTVALALIDTKQRILVDADLGDSHVVLAEHVKRNKKEMMKLNMLDPSLRLHHLGTKKNEWTVTRLSTPHDLDNPSEKRRIEAAGGEIKYDTGVPRIGALNMARALGDTELKQPRVNRLAGHNLTDLDGVETGLKPGRRASADLVSNKAHFNWRRLQGGSLLFLSSDGIGNEKDAESAARTATTLKMQGHTATQIAEELTKRAGKVQGADNCTVLIVILEAPSGAQ